MLSMLVWLLKEVTWLCTILLPFCYVYVKFLSLNRLARRSTRQNVLLITAHPDDECMFFTPTILSLINQGHNIYLVCMSKGDFYGQGELRKKELIASTSILGLPINNVSVIDDDRFKDGPSAEWDVNGLGERIVSVAQRVRANIVITFDSGGVSRHANHTAIYNAVHSLQKTEQLVDTSVYVLQTTSLLRKYLLFHDIPVSSMFCLTCFVNSPSEVWKGWRAMQAHQSQLAWFRKLYMLLSRYMYVNTLHELR